MPSGAVATIARIKLGALLLAGGAAAFLGWFATERLAFALAQQEKGVESLGEPARTLLSTPLLAAGPGVAAMALALVGLAMGRLRTAALILATLVLLLGVVAILVSLLQVLAPMYELPKV